MFWKIFLRTFIVLTVAMMPAAFAGKVELTTYYPAPYGEYSQLKATGTNTSDDTINLEAGGSAGTGLVVTNANNVGIGTDDPQGALDVSSTTAAFYPPRVTTEQRNAIASTDIVEAGKKGAVVYNLDTSSLEVYDGNKQWKSASGGSGAVVGGGMAYGSSDGGDYCCSWGQASCPTSGSCSCPNDGSSPCQINGGSVSAALTCPSGTQRGQVSAATDDGHGYAWGYICVTS
jgi:hypothetical protein